MPIRPLPAPSIRALGSGQALSDPSALIKELLDNSLDAHATQISVEASANTLDILQVKDNGHGIPPEDRDAMALRHHTSKIRDFGDIQSCRTLGFRGEALASAAELAAGGLTITTRVEGERVAVACSVDRSGVVVGRRPVGAAVGTTVRVEGFLKGLPVRRENALRGAQKSIARFRALLQRYYISHPHCRFSLRILASGTKGRSEDIVYAPSRTVPEAVQKAVGKDVTATCEWVDTSSSPQNQDSDSIGEEQPIFLEAFLPKPTASPAVIAKKPQCTNFVFVDFRAVSCARGTLKQILALYKSYLRSALGAPGVSDPFIYLNIRCLPGSYDPNIEPAKDDVMFYDAEAVVTAVEKMLKGFYGELKIDDNTSNIKGKAKEAPRNGFEVLLARKPKPVPAPVDTSAETPVRKSSSSVSSSRRPNMRPAGEPEYDEDEEELAAMEVDAVMSSWFTGAGINSPLGKEVFPPLAGAAEDQDHPIGGTEDVEEAAGPSNQAAPISEVVPLVTGADTTSPVTPRRKSTNWGFNMYNGADEDGDDEEYTPMEPNASDNEESARKDITISNPWTTAKLNAPITHSSSPVSSSPLPYRPVRKPFKPPSIVSPGSGMISRNRADAPITPIASSPGGFREESAGESAQGLGGNARVMGPWASGPRRRGGGEDDKESPPAARKGFISAAKFYQDHPGDGDDDTDEAQHHRRSKPAPKRRRLNDSPDPEANPAPEPVSPPKPSPHKNRFLAATAALHLPAQQTTLTGEPPVLFASPAQRAKSRRRTRTLLPLETVPELAMQTHMLSRSAGTNGLKGVFAALRACDGYVGGSAAGMGGAEGVDDGLFFSECAEWEDTNMLGQVVEAWLKRMNVDFEGVGWEMIGGGEGARALRLKLLDDNHAGIYAPV